MIDKLLRWMLFFLPLTLLAKITGAPEAWLFFLSAAAIIPLARLIGEATEELAAYTGPAFSGLLNATFGNATELIIGILALHAGLVEVVKASLTGSIIGNLLFVTGAAMFFGGVKRKEQKFNRTAAMASASTMLLAVIALVIPAVFVQTAPQAGGRIIEELSVAVALLLLVVYFANLLFNLRTHKHLYLEEVGKIEEGEWSKKKALAILVLSTVAVAVVSELLVGSIEPLVAQFGWTELFIGVIFVAMVGNAAEHTSAIVMSMKNRMDLALQISIGSATQIAMLAAPILVLVSLAFGQPMSLVFNLFELVAIVFSVLIVNLVVEDGESNWLEGLQLLTAYAIMAVAFYFHP